MTESLLEKVGGIQLNGSRISYERSKNNVRNYVSYCDCGDCSSDNCDCSQGGDCVCTDCNEGSSLD
jgi:hypothetical protein